MRSQVLLAASAVAALGLTAVPSLADTIALPGVSIVSYGDAGYTWLDDDRASSLSSTRTWQTTAGADATFSNKFLIGAGVTYGESDIERRAGALTAAGSGDSESITGFGRITVYLPSQISVGAIAGYGNTDTDERVVIGNATFATTSDADTVFVGGNAQYSIQSGMFFATPGVRILYTETETDASSSAGTSSKSTDTFTRGSIGADLGYFYAVSGGYLIPIFRAYYVYDFELPQGFSDESAVDLAAGLTYSAGNLTAGAEYNTTVGREDIDTHTVHGYVSYKF